MRLDDLAARVGGQVVGEGARQLSGLTDLVAAGPEDLSFLAEKRHLAAAQSSRAGALVAPPELVEDLAGRDLLVVASPKLALATLGPLFYPPPERAPGIHPTAVVEKGATVDPQAYIGALAVIGTGSLVEAGAAILAGAVVGRHCRVGAGSVLHPHAVLYDGTQLGERTEIHAGAVLGSDGFGYATDQGRHHKVPQVGRVVVEDEVEVGANSAVDRATFGETRLGAGSKIDNLVQVGHNVEVGKGCILCGQAGIAGSATLGDYVVLGGQAGSAGHLEIADQVQVAAKAAVLQAVPKKGQRVAGIPAVDLAQWRRQVIYGGRLAEMARRLAALERRLAEMEES